MSKKASAQAEAEGNFATAAITAFAAGDSERERKMWRRFSAQHETDRDFATAAVGADLAGDVERAKTLREQAKKLGQKPKPFIIH